MAKFKLPKKGKLSIALLVFSLLVLASGAYFLTTGKELFFQSGAAPIKYWLLGKTPTPQPKRIKTPTPKPKVSTPAPKPTVVKKVVTPAPTATAKSTSGQRCSFNGDCPRTAPYCNYYYPATDRAYGVCSTVKATPPVSCGLTTHWGEECAAGTHCQLIYSNEGSEGVCVKN